MEQEAKLSRG